MTRVSHETIALYQQVRAMTLDEMEAWIRTATHVSRPAHIRIPHYQDIRLYVHYRLQAARFRASGNAFLSRSATGHAATLTQRMNRWEARTGQSSLPLASAATSK